MFRQLVIGAVLSASVSCLSFAEERSTPNLVDVEQTTASFVQLFRDTCFESRSDLKNLRDLAAARRWKELEGPFPFRNEEQQSTTLVAWGFWRQGVPYQSALVSFDATAPAVTCVLMSTAVNSNELPTLIQRAFGLVLVKEGRDSTNRFSQFESSAADGKFVIGCSDMSPVKVPFGQCALVRPKSEAVGETPASFSDLQSRTPQSFLWPVQVVNSFRPNE